MLWYVTLADQSHRRKNILCTTVVGILSIACTKTFWSKLIYIFTFGTHYKHYGIANGSVKFIFVMKCSIGLVALAKIQDYFIKCLNSAFRQQSQVYFCPAVVLHVSTAVSMLSALKSSTSFKTMFFIPRKPNRKFRFKLIIDINFFCNESIYWVDEDCRLPEGPLRAVCSLTVGSSKSENPEIIWLQTW